MNTPIKYGHIVVLVGCAFIGWLIVHLFFSIFQFKENYYTIKCSQYEYDRAVFFTGTTTPGMPDLECVGADSSEFKANRV